jgi:hypothetical protein
LTVDNQGHDTVAGGQLNVSERSAHPPAAGNGSHCSAVSGSVVIEVERVLVIARVRAFKLINRRIAPLDAFLILLASTLDVAGRVNQFGPLVTWDMKGEARVTESYP